MPGPLAGLLRDHEQVAGLIADARATFEGAALHGPGTTDVIEVARGLQRFLARDLTLHIAKEEVVLFPAMRALADNMDDVLQHMVAQHDEIRARQDLIDRTMAALDGHHHEVEEERDAFISGVGTMPAALTPAVLEDLRERSIRLQRILLGHFADEEEDLFAPAAALLTSDVLERLTAQMVALEQMAPPA